MGGRDRRQVSQVVLLAAVLALLVGLGGCYLLRREPAPLRAPEEVSATQGDYPDLVRVSWSAVEDATRYQIQRATGEHATYTAVGVTTETTYDDTDVTGGIVYWYRIRSGTPTEWSSPSTPSTGYVGEPAAAPPPPADLRATLGDHPHKVVVRWDPVEEADTYEVYRRGSESGSYYLVGASTTTEYEDYDVTPGQSYWYRVRACGEGGCSQLSPSAAWGFAEAGPLPGEPPARPRGVLATDGEHSERIAVSWRPSAGAEFYTIWRADVDDDPYDSERAPLPGQYERVGEAEGTEYADVYRETTNPLRGCTEYWYRVRACTEDGCSELSLADSGYRGSRMDEVGPPTIAVTYREYDDHIRVSWSEVAGAAEYQVHITGPGIAGTNVETVDPADGLLYRHEYDAATGVPHAERTYMYSVLAVGIDECGTSPPSIALDGRRRGAPLAPEITDLDPVCTNCPQADEEDENWKVTVTWAWPWEPWASPNPVQWFEVFRRGPGEAEFSKLGTVDGLSFVPALDYGLEEPDDPEDIITYEFFWDDVDVSKGRVYEYRVHAGRTIDATPYFRRSGIKAVWVDD